MRKISILLGIFLIVVFCSFFILFFIYKDNIQPFVDKDTSVYIHVSSRHLQESSVVADVFTDLIASDKRDEIQQFFDLISSLSNELGVLYTDKSSWSIVFSPKDQSSVEDLLINPARSGKNEEGSSLTLAAFETPLYMSWHDEMLQLSSQKNTSSIGTQEGFSFDLTSIVSDFRGIPIRLHPDKFFSNTETSSSFFGSTFIYLGDFSLENALILLVPSDETMHMRIMNTQQGIFSFVYDLLFFSSGISSFEYDFALDFPSDSHFFTSTSVAFWNIVSSLEIHDGFVYLLSGERNDFVFLSQDMEALSLLQEKLSLYFKEKYPTYEAASLEDGTFTYELFGNDSVVFEDISQAEDIRYKVFVKDHEEDVFYIWQSDGFVLFSRDDTIFSQNIQSVYSFWESLQSSCGLGGGYVRQQDLFENYNVFEMCSVE